MGRCRRFARRARLLGAVDAKRHARRLVESHLRDFASCTHRSRRNDPMMTSSLGGTPQGERIAIATTVWLGTRTRDPRHASPVNTKHCTEKTRTDFPRKDVNECAPSDVLFA